MPKAISRVYGLKRPFSTEPSLQYAATKTAIVVRRVEMKKSTREEGRKARGASHQKASKQNIEGKRFVTQISPTRFCEVIVSLLVHLSVTELIDAVLSQSRECFTLIPLHHEKNKLLPQGPNLKENVQPRYVRRTKAASTAPEEALRKALRCNATAYLASVAEGTKAKEN